MTADGTTRHESDEATQSLERVLGDVVAAIADSLGADRWEPALILTFVTIDSMAWLDRAAGEDVTKPDFISWVDRYLLPDNNLPCTGEELYSARCGMLHSLTADSRLQRQNREQVRKVYFVRRRQGDAESVDALLSTMFAEPQLPVYLDVDHFFWALQRALTKYAEALETDDVRWAVVAERVRRSYLQRGTLR